MVDKKRASNSTQTKAGKVTTREEALGAIILFIIILIALLVFIFQDFDKTEPIVNQTPEEPINEVNERYDDLASAINSGDVTACEFLDTPEQIICIQTIEGNYETEDNLESQDIIDQAVQAGDATVCDTITDPIEKMYCQAQSGADISSGASLDDNLDVQLIIQRAFETGDASLCDQITNPPQKQLCLSKV